MHHSSQAWYAPLRDMASKAQLHGNARSSADLHAARQRHQGQFWTPTAVAALMWRIAHQASERRRGVVHVLDTSIGSGRLIQFANPDRHVIAGVDPDARCIHALSEALDAAGIGYDLRVSGMEAIAPRNFDLCLINPPFSVHLESPLLEPSSCTHYGRMGPHTSALSHDYALVQALAAAAVVVALVPRSLADQVGHIDEATGRLRAVFDLPANAFADEGASVRTSIVVFGDRRSDWMPCRVQVADLAMPLPDLELDLGKPKSGRLRLRTVDPSTPTIKTPVTGKRRVRVVRHRRELRLKFECGLIQARVMNALYRRRLVPTDPGHPLPRGIAYAGQGQLMLDAHLLQEDPVASLNALFDRIETLGGHPMPDPGIMPWLRKQARRIARRRTPFVHTVWRDSGALPLDAPTGTAVALTTRKVFLTNPGSWGAPSARAGTRLALEIVPGAEVQREYRVSLNGTCRTLSRAEVEDSFEVPGAGSPHWHTVHAGRRKAFPADAALLQARAKRLGLDRILSWRFQLDDVVELAIGRGGAIAGHDMGLGKSRMLAGFCLLMGGERNLIVVPAHLIDEISDEMVKLDRHDWQVIDSPEKLDTLKRLNIISYARLRRPLYHARGATSGGRRTYARALRRRIHTLVADEAHLASNPDSQQTRALVAVSPKVVLGATGTPVPNYPRNLLEIIRWVAGESNAVQPYGRQRVYMEPRLLKSCQDAEKGNTVFAERFITTEWVTHEFADSLNNGGKREVPKLREVNAYRDLASRFVLRRVTEEPDVARYVSRPVSSYHLHEVDFDADHLSYYLDTAREFANWWKARHDDTDRHKLNLVVLLARIGAVVRALNHPQHGIGAQPPFPGLTSKQREALDLIESFCDDGRKTLVYGNHPELMTLMHRHLGERDIDSILYTGAQPRKRRNEQMKMRFRRGQTPVLLATLGVAETGLNLHEASRVVFLGRAWTPRSESQAAARVLRPQQQQDVEIHHFEVCGSIDQYQRQMIEMKAAAAADGIDWAETQRMDIPFDHWETMLHRFIKGLETLENKSKEIRHAA
jgi:hypothetical protein